ncbi:MAG: cell division protein FtsQ/DivIB [Wenzhouxiangellaceae bacterium]
MSLRAWLILTSTTAGLLLLAWVAMQPHDAERWPIRWLEVEGGLERVTTGQVRAAVADQARRGFFALDMEAVRRDAEALPWVAQALVSRQWPDALVIEVIEHRAVARWNESSLLSDHGERFEVAGTGGMQGLVRLAGPEQRIEEVFATWRRLTGTLNRRGLELSALELDARGAWTLQLTDGRILLLGRESLTERVARFLTVERELDDIQDLLRIDLRYPNGLAVMRASDVVPAESTEQEKLAERAGSAGERDHHG